MQAWEGFLQAQEKELGKETVTQWLRSLKIIHFDAGNLYLEAKDALLAQWFEEHIRHKVRSSLLNNNHRPIKVHLTVVNDASPAAEKPTQKGSQKNKAEPPTTLILNPDPLDSRATFEHFITGEKNGPNELPLKLLKEIGTNVSFNPIYIHGAPGTGKTHLLMSVAQHLKKQGISALYVRTETFTEHVVRAMRIGAMQEFRRYYRNTSVLIVDDVHILARRSATQEEFFHTFNTLHTSGRQILLSSPIAPSHLVDIEPRLVSRFEWGIALHLEKLSKQGLKDLLVSRCKTLQVKLSEESLELLAETFHTSHHSLCRALDALVMRAGIGTRSNSGQTLTTKEITHLLADLIKLENEEALSPDKIIRAVSEFYGIRPDDILGKAQTQDCALPRQIAMHLCRSQLKMPYLHIGTAFARDHSTVMSSVKQIQKKLDDKDKETCASVTEILRKLQ